MEHFNEPHRKIGEKNVYLLHLDVPRIILISLAGLGIVIATFLLGMNFAKEGDGPGASITGTDPLLNRQSDLSLINPDIPEPPLGVEKQDSAAMKDETDPLAGNDKSHDIIPGKAIPAETVTADAVKEFQRPGNDEKTAKNDRKPAVSEKKHRDVARNRNKTRPREQRKTERNRVVEVSSKDEHPRERSSGGFAIQVASYDNRSTADAEADRLKRRHYDAFVERTTISGRRYYRVRIGPISSHSAAEQVLQDIQESNRYGESYMIRQ